MYYVVSHAAEGKICSRTRLSENGLLRGSRRSLKEFELSLAAPVVNPLMYSDPFHYSNALCTSTLRAFIRGSITFGDKMSETSMGPLQVPIGSVSHLLDHSIMASNIEESHDASVDRFTGN